jgi:hypothetical protein
MSLRKVESGKPVGVKGRLQDQHASGLRIGADQPGDGLLPELQIGIAESFASGCGIADI